jgi:hypothetical protein
LSTEDIPGGAPGQRAAVHKSFKRLSIHDMQGGCWIGDTA